MKLTTNLLEELRESSNLTIPIREVANILLLAMNDWPKPLLSAEEYVNEIEIFSGKKSTKNNLKEALKQIDYRKNSWYAESTTQVIEIFEYYNHQKSLVEILNDFSAAAV